MAPIYLTDHEVGSTLEINYYHALHNRQATTSRPVTGDWRQGASDEEFILESWSQGVVVGALMIMGCITIANMRKGVLLHKLILAELLLAMSHGTFCFMSFQGYGWYLSSTAMLLYVSWIIHNIVAWLKVRPFFSQPGGFFKPTLGIWTTRVYLASLALSVPVIIFQISNNFRFFNNRGGYYQSTRPYEPLMRDPWWVFTCLALFHVIQKCYGTGTLELLRRSPRFGILLAAIFLSIVFTACDIAASISSTAIIGQTEGINPWWKLSLVFKCLTDTIMLDDFKTELKRLGIKRIAKEEKRRNTISLVSDQDPTDEDGPKEKVSSSLGSQERKSIRWFRNNDLARASTTCDISPTTSIQKTNGVPNGHRGPRNQNTKALTDPNADMDELEFNTALSLSPSHLLNEDSEHRESHDQIERTDQHQETNRQPHQRDSINGHTKRLAHLPSLKQWRFEPIKASQARNSTQHNHHENNNKTSSSSDQIIQKQTSTTQPSNSTEASKSEAEVDNSPPSNTGHESRIINNRHFRNGDQEHNISPSHNSGSDEAVAQDDRLRRFKQSIGA